MRISKSLIFVVLFLSSSAVNAQNWITLGNGFDQVVGSFYTDSAINLLYIGGAFKFHYDDDTTYTVGIAVYNGDSISPVGCGFDWDCSSVLLPNAGVSGLNTISKYNGDIIGAGGFLKADGKPIERIAKWNGITWDSLGHDLNSPAKRLYVHNNDLYVGGTFDIAGSIEVHGLDN
jgi:hypothetical protein